MVISSVTSLLFRRSGASGVVPIHPLTGKYLSSDSICSLGRLFGFQIKSFQGSSRSHISMVFFAITCFFAAFQNASISPGDGPMIAIASLTGCPNMSSNFVMVVSMNKIGIDSIVPSSSFVMLFSTCVTILIFHFPYVVLSVSAFTSMFKTSVVDPLSLSMMHPIDTWTPNIGSFRVLNSARFVVFVTRISAS